MRWPVLGCCGLWRLSIRPMWMLCFGMQCCGNRPHTHMHEIFLMFSGRNLRVYWYSDIISVPYWYLSKGLGLDNFNVYVCHQQLSWILCRTRCPFSRIINGKQPVGTTTCREAWCVFLLFSYIICNVIKTTAFFDYCFSLIGHVVIHRRLQATPRARLPRNVLWLPINPYKPTRYVPGTRYYTYKVNAR